MFDINKLTRRKDSENVVSPSSHRHRWYVFDSDTNEIRSIADVILDCECISPHCVQWSVRIVEQFERLIAGVGDCNNDLEILDSVDCVGTCQVQGEARGSRDCCS